MSQRRRESKPPKSDLSSQAELPRQGLMREFWQFLRHNKKWWMTPIIVLLLIMGALVVLSSSALAPFIYPLM